MVDFLPQVIPQYPAGGMNALLRSQELLGNTITGFGDQAKAARDTYVHNQAGALAAQGDIQGAMNTYYKWGMPDAALRMNKEWQENQLFPYQKMQTQYGALGTKAGYEQTQQYRELYGPGAAPNAGAARVAPPGAVPATPAPQAGATENATRTPPSVAQPSVPATTGATTQQQQPTPSQQGAQAVAKYVKAYVLDPSVPVDQAQEAWQSLKQDPYFAPHFAAHFKATPETGNFLQDAQGFHADMTSGHPSSGTPQAGAQMIPGAPRPQLPAGVPGVTAPPPVAGAAPPIAAPQPGMTPQQQMAEQLIAAERQHIQYLAGVPGMAAVADTRLKTLQEQISKGEYYVPSVGMVPLAGHAENAANMKGLEESSTASAKYYDNLHKGLTGSAMIAAQQKQNIAIIKTILDDPGFGYGSVSALQQGTLRALASAHIAPEAAANREVFNQTMARILADQFSGLKSLASETGEQAGRIFKPMLDIEESALPNANDTVEGIKRKIDILDKAGDLMMRWGDAADTYISHPASKGRLDANFDKALRSEISQARIAPYAESSGGAEAGAQAAGQAVAKPAEIRKQLMALPDGVHDLPGGRVIKRGNQITPAAGKAGTATNPYGSKMEVQGPGDLAFEEGKLWRRTPNWFTDRWEEVK